MGCIENLKYEMILPLGASFKECREYVEKNYPEVWYVEPGTSSSTSTSSGSHLLRLASRTGKRSRFPTPNPVTGPISCGSRGKKKLNVSGKRQR